MESGKLTPPEGNDDGASSEEHQKLSEAQNDEHLFITNSDLVTETKIEDFLNSSNDIVGSNHRNIDNVEQSRIHNGNEEAASEEHEDDEDREEQEEDGEEEEEDGGVQEDGEEDEDEEEEEPKLKYSRLTGLPPSVFSSDVVSTCLISDTFFAFATHSGWLHLTSPDMTPIRSIHAHRASILSLSTDGTYLASGSIDGTVVIGSINDPKDISAADFQRPIHAVALDPNYKTSKVYVSAGMAGNVVYSERNWRGRRVDTILHSTEENDAIISLHWLGNLILWMSEDGITIYSTISKAILKHINRPANSPRADLYKPRICVPESNRIYVAWVDHIWNLKISTTTTPNIPNSNITDTNVAFNAINSIIGNNTLPPASGTTVKSYKKNNRIMSVGGGSSFLSSGASIISAHPEEIVEIESVRKVDWLISGIVPFKEDTIMLLTYSMATNSDTGGEISSSRKRIKANPPELKLIDSSTGEEIYADVLSMRGYEQLGLDDYHLGHHSGSVPGSPAKYFIISATDAIIAMERTLNDRIEWLLERNMYKKCWEMSENILDSIKRMSIGINYVNSLVENNKWSEAAEFLQRVLNAVGLNIPENKSVLREEWDRWGRNFIRSGHLSLLAGMLPIDRDLDLKQELYNSVLMHCIEHDQPMLIEIMRKWPVTLYDYNSLKNQLEDLLNETEVYPTNDSSSNSIKLTSLRMALADLYTRNNDPYSALNHLLILHHATVVDHISKYHLLSYLEDSIPRVFTYNLTIDELQSAPLDIIRDKTQAVVNLFVEGRHQILPEKVIQILHDDADSKRDGLDVILFLYLEELNRRDSFISKGFGDLQVRLYAEFDRPKLIGFLNKNNNYNLTDALEICEKNNYIPELVYLLGKVGQNQRALKLIIEKIGDPEQALRFARIQNDKDLWNDLIRYSMKNSLFIKALLENFEGGNSAVDPIRIIKDIPPNSEIPGLKQTLLKLFKDKEMLVSLNSGALDIIKGEAGTYSKHLRTIQVKGDSIDFEKDYPTLDLSKPYVLTPVGQLKSEEELIGRKLPVSWYPGSNDDELANSFWSVGRKVARLAYILRHLKDSPLA